MADTEAYQGKGYWATQIAGSAVLTILFAVAAVFIGASPGEDSGGQSVMVGLTSLLFFATLIWLVKQFSKQTAERRAVYAWVIMQQYGDRVHYDVAGDFQTMGIAQRASRGELTRAEIDQLQSLRPDVSYPGKLPRSAAASPDL